MKTRIFLLISAIIFTCVSAFAMCGVCGVGDEKAQSQGEKGAFHSAAKEAAVKDGVKEITYKQFMKIRDSGEKYVLLDVLSADSFNKGHIEGAVFFPVDTINKETASQRLSKDDHIIVYCGSFLCTASTGAAKKLAGLGYDVLDYKGGLEEWQKMGNKLISQK